MRQGGHLLALPLYRITNAPGGNRSLKLTCTWIERGGHGWRANAGELLLVVDSLDDAFVSASHKAVATAVNGLDDALRLARIANRLACLLMQELRLASPTNRLGHR
jgi:hypothetical protein